MSNALVKRQTSNYNFKVINYDFPRWHNAEWDNWDALDAVLTTAGAATVSGTWTNNTVYPVGARIIDTDLGTVWNCLVAHTSAAAGTFAADRIAHPTYWNLFSSLPNYRGAWVTATLYLVGDVVYTGTYVYYFCVERHTSAAAFATDSAKWSVIFDTTATTAANAASAAASAASASSASTSASTATTKATAADASATAAQTYASNSSTYATNSANSATTASGHATTATTQAGIATTQAATATAAATTATTQAGIATTKATEASDSKIASATSAAESAYWAGQAAAVGGVPEAPNTGLVYARKGTGATWIEVPATYTAAATPFTPTGTVGASDVQSAIAEVDNEKLAKTGGTMTGCILGATVANGGTNSTPAFAIDGDPDTGMYSGGANVLRFATQGTQRVSIGTSGIDFALVLRQGDGTNAAPTFTFTSDANTGMYKSGTSTIGFSTASTLRFTIDTASATCTLPFLAPNGSLTNVAFGFSGDPNTGMYATGTSDVLALVSGGSAKVTVQPTLISFANQIVLPSSGSASATVLNFNTAGTGIYGDAADVKFASAGALKLTVGTTITAAIAVTLPGNPSNALEAAPKQYIDAKITNKITVASSAPGSPATNDLWVDTT